MQIVKISLQSFKYPNKKTASSYRFVAYITFGNSKHSILAVFVFINYYLDQYFLFQKSLLSSCFTFHYFIECFCILFITVFILNITPNYTLTFLSSIHAVAKYVRPTTTNTAKSAAKKSFCPITISGKKNP